MPSEVAMERAQIVRLAPGIAKMTRGELEAMKLDPEAVAAVAATMQGEGVTPGADGSNPNLKLNGWSVVAREPLLRFKTQLAPLDAFSTNVSKELVVPGNPKVKPKMEVAIIDDSGEAQINDFSSYNTRDNAAQTSVEVELQKVEDVITIFARDIERGVDIAPQVAASLARMANGVWKVAMEGIAVGTAQGDDSSKVVEAYEIKPVDGGFSWGYANKRLTEVIQPRTNAMLFNSTYYAELKPEDKDGKNPSELDADLVQKVQGLEHLGKGVVGLLTNKRAVGVGVAAPYMMQGAYASYQQLELDGVKVPVSVVSYFLPEYNCIKMVFGTYVGVTVADVTAIKPLVAAAADGAA